MIRGKRQLHVSGTVFMSAVLPKDMREIISMGPKSVTGSSANRGFRTPGISGGCRPARNRKLRMAKDVTDVNGKFNIDFRALADPGINKESKPVFRYRIETDITDLNGETRSASTTVAASYQSFQIVSSLPQESRMDADSLQQIPVTTQNASGEFVPQLLTVTVYRLKIAGSPDQEKVLGAARSVCDAESGVYSVFSE